MNFFDFSGITISALAAAVPDNHQNIMDYAPYFAKNEVARFCESTGVRQRYIGNGIGTISSDLCVAAAEKIFNFLDIDRASIDGLIFISQCPDYPRPGTSYLIQHRLGLDNCGLVYDSNIGCSAFPFGIQMACANIMAGCNRVLLLIGDAVKERDVNKWVPKDSLLFGDCGIAALIEKTAGGVAPIRIALNTIGDGYKKIIIPYGGARHPLVDLYIERGEILFNPEVEMERADVFSFSIAEAPKTARRFFEHFMTSINEYDLISIHQANKLIIDHVAKRIKAPKEKVMISLDRYGNTSGATTALNICDYAERNNSYSGKKKILLLAFGIGLNVAVADFEFDMSRCLPIVKTRGVFDDGITSYTYF